MLQRTACLLIALVLLNLLQVLNSQQNAYEQPPPYGPAPANPYAPPPPAPAKTEDEYEKDRAQGAKNRPFPLDSCYLNTDGFMCCNKELEKLMDKTYSDLAKSRNGNWKKCNIHQIAVATQRNCEDHFGVDFEVIAGAGDYASKNLFSQDLICKIKRDSSYILAFATPAL